MMRNRSLFRGFALLVAMRIRDPLFEYGCHEGNYSLRNILAGARKQEREKAEPIR